MGTKTTKKELEARIAELEEELSGGCCDCEREDTIEDQADQICILEDLVEELRGDKFVLCLGLAVLEVLALALLL